VKTFPVICLLVAGIVFGAQAQTPLRTEEQLLAALSERTELDIRSIDFFRTASPEHAWKAFEFLNSHLPQDGLDFIRKAGRGIAENPAIEKYVTDGMAKLPYHYDNPGERAGFLVPLGNIPAPWSLRLLGHYLTDETPMIVPESLDGHTPTAENADFAVIGLQKMDFIDSPPKSPRGTTKEVNQAWRNWWKLNEGRAEQRIREINPGYYPPQPVETPKSTPIPKPVVIGEYAATPAVSNKPKPPPSPSATPVAAKQTEQSDWGVYLIGTLVVICALGAIGWATRRKAA
jgi:hypothetical protein